MPWKQDLAKLKQQLGPEAAPPAPKPPPKPTPNPAGPPALADEDAVFLSAMGLRPSVPRPAKPATSLESPPISLVVMAPAPESFQEAIKDLKGLKPLAKGIQSQPNPPPPVPVTAIEPPEPTTRPLPIPLQPPAPLILRAAESEPVPQPILPLRFQLAAGMAIEVDGTLDLRGHSLADAMERLKDRLGDGMVLGWRSLQVTLGPDPALHEGLLSWLASGGAPMITRYAQAPVPMGGTHAWLLYFSPAPPNHA